MKILSTSEVPTAISRNFLLILLRKMVLNLQLSSNHENVLVGVPEA
jgi:hypothetical protein